MTTPTNGVAPAVTPASFSEAPASGTIRVTTPGGYDLMLTFRATRVNDLLAQAQAVEGWLMAHNFAPAPTHKNSKPTAMETTEAAPNCAIHKTPMTKRAKDGRSWWSCSEKLDTGEWCPYRPK